MGFARNLLIICISFFLLSEVAIASADIWTDEPENNYLFQKSSVNKDRYRALRADISKLKGVMDAAPLENTVSPTSFIDLPLPDGRMHTFVLEESPILSADQAVKFPAFKTYRVRSKDGSAITGRLDLLPTGFHAYLTTDKGMVFIDPDPGSITKYRSFYKNDNIANKPRQFSCGVKTAVQPRIFQVNTDNVRQKTAVPISNQLLTYRLAIAATFEYVNAVAVGKTINNQAELISNAQAEILTAINRVNEIYERDLGISLQLVVNNSLISTDANDFTNFDADALITQSKPFIDAAIGGVGAYDIGHVFSTGAGGLATLGAVCNDGFKAEGITGIVNPLGDAFYIDYVAHELGHQFSADHTFNGITLDCGGSNRNAATAYEPGSGSTIMGYAGICGTENIQVFAASPTAGGASDDTFHAGSIDEIISFTRNGSGYSCAQVSTNSNSAPVVDAGQDYTIPAKTPFELSGSATDVNNDTLTYQWDEMDIGTSTNATTYGSDLGDNPLFRSFAPSSNPVRTLPRIATLVIDIEDKAEHLPTTDRALNFRLTVRDQNRGVAHDSMRITVDKSSGPFRVLSAATSVTLDVTQPQVLEWDVACTGVAPVSCANVDILLSTDSGVNFSTTLIAATANDGEETVNFPAVSSSTAVVKIACTDNIFFDVNNALMTLQQGSGSVLKSTGAGTAGNSGDSCALIPRGDTAVGPSVSGGGGSLNIWFLIVLAMLRTAYRRFTGKPSITAAI